MKKQGPTLLALVAICMGGMSGVAKAANSGNSLDVCIAKAHSAGDARIAGYTKQMTAATTPEAKKYYQNLITAVPSSVDSAISTCQDNASNTKTKTDTSVDTSGDCGHANMFTGTNQDVNLKGNNCQVAADAVQNNKTRQQAVDSAALATTIGVGTLASNKAANDSSNNSAQNAQKMMMQTTAITKMVQAAEEAYSASQLNSAADAAKLANKNLKMASSNVTSTCNSDTQNADADCQRQLNLAAANSKLTTDQVGWISRGATEAKTQADAASSAGASQGMLAMTNGLIGAMTWMQAGKAAQNANLAPALSYGLGGSMVSGGGPMVGGTIANPSSGTDPGSGNALLPGTGTGGIQSGMMPGQSPLTTPKGTVAATSTVSGNATGGGIGGGDSSGKSSGDKKPQRGLGNTGVGTLGDGGGSIFRGGGGLGMKDGGPDTALTDAIKKMLNPDGTEKKEDARSLASSGQAPSGDSESFALPADVSLFQQITAKYHQLNTNGAI